MPLILLAFDDPLVGAVAALALQVVTFLDYPLLLPWAYFYGGAAVWLAWGAVLARYVVAGLAVRRGCCARRSSARCRWRSAPRLRRAPADRPPFLRPLRAGLRRPSRASAAATPPSDACAAQRASVAATADA